MNLKDYIPAVIGAEFSEGIYAGIMRGLDGAPDYHLVVLPGDEKLNWEEAKAFAERAGGDLPTRREQRLLFANVKDQFQEAWYWSSEQHADDADYAWSQYFDYGGQLYDHKSYAGRARAVRRLPIQPFDHSEVLLPKEQFMRDHLRDGEIYAGLLLGRDGAPDQHVFLLADEAESVDWAAAKDWAEKAGGRLPTRSEQSLLFANLKHEFKAAWYWSSEQRADDADYAWGQYFSFGYQYYVHKSSAGRARAVRSLII